MNSDPIHVQGPQKSHIAADRAAVVDSSSELFGWWGELSGLDEAWVHFFRGVGRSEDLPAWRRRRYTVSVKGDAKNERKVPAVF